MRRILPQGGFVLDLRRGDLPSLFFAGPLAAAALGLGVLANDWAFHEKMSGFTLLILCLVAGASIWTGVAVGLTNSMRRQTAELCEPGCQCGGSIGAAAPT